ncbi:MAG: tetratricopeptide repeat protein [Chlorobia bacterium]|nr:tetratricopeptide repeat protein [Fimbriimonadaceae bacterium]
MEQWWIERGQTQESKAGGRQELAREMAVTLADWNLLAWDGATETFQLHPLIREYFVAQASDSAEVHQLLSEWYAGQPTVERPTSIEDVRHRWVAVEHALRARCLARCAELMFGPFLPGSSFSEWLAAWGHLSSGITLLERMAEIAHGQLRGQFLLARSAMLHQSGRFQQSVGDIDEAISIFDGDHTSYERLINLAKALANRANMHREIGRSSTAVADYDRAIALFRSGNEQQPATKINLALAFVNRGNALLDLGKWSLALADYDQACTYCYGLLLLFPQKAEAMLANAQANRGIVLADLEEMERALSDFTNAINSLTSLQELGNEDLAPRLAHARIMMGATLRAANRSQEAAACLDLAIESLRRLVDAGRKDVEALLSLAWMNRAQVALNMDENALEAAQNSISIYQRLIAEGGAQFEGSLAHARLIRAEIRYRAGDRAGAKEDRSEGFARMRSLMQEWAGESDIHQVFLRKATDAITYLLPKSPDEAVPLFNETYLEVAKIFSSSGATEGLHRTARKAIVSIRPLIPALTLAGAHVEGIEELTDTSKTM